MHNFRLFISLLLLSLFSNAHAQTLASQYDAAASAYQSGQYAQAEKLWTILAKKGDANSQYAMGIMHLKKEAQNAQDARAFNYLAEASKQQHLAAMFNLGVAYWEGRGVTRQPQKALNWWEIAAQRQDAGAQYNLGLAYYIGEGRPQDNAKALHWVQLAKENGHPQASTLLAKLKSPENNSGLSTLARQNIQTTTTVKKPVTNSILNKPAKAATIAKRLPPIRKTVPISKTTNQTTRKANPAIKNTTTTGRQLTELRARPNATAASLGTLKPSTEINVIRHAGTWTQVVAADSFPVWVYETFLNDQGTGIGTIKGNNVNIRPRPSTDNRTSPALGQLNEGDKVAIVLKRSPWVKIIPPTAFPAWVASKDIQ